MDSLHHKTLASLGLQGVLRLASTQLCKGVSGLVILPAVKWGKFQSMKGEGGRRACPFPRVIPAARSQQNAPPEDRGRSMVLRRDLGPCVWGSHARGTPVEDLRLRSVMSRRGTSRQALPKIPRRAFPSPEAGPSFSVGRDSPLRNAARTRAEDQVPTAGRDW